MKVISTHALREEGDGKGNTAIQSVKISTHALREEGDFELFLADQRAEKFLPTPSARRATVWNNNVPTD